MFTITQIIVPVLLLSIGCSKCQKPDHFGPPKCCADSLSPTFHKEKSWEDTLRQAAYQSIIQHLDYPGTLDGRLDRDQKLWRHLQEASFSLGNNYLYGDVGRDFKTGILIMKKLHDNKFGFEFHETEDTNFGCSNNQCNPPNSSLLATWQIRKRGNFDGMLIKVNLPGLNKVPIEDMYEYNGQFGLKRLDSSPIQHNSFSSFKGHRFSYAPRAKGEFKRFNDFREGFKIFDDTRTEFKGFGRSKGGFKHFERMDFRFENSGSKAAFGRAQIIPTSFVYDSPFYSTEESGDGWTRFQAPKESGESWTRFQAPRKPYPTFIENTHFKYETEAPFLGANNPFSNIESGRYPHSSEAPPSISPSLNLDETSRDVGFLPSTGPIKAPPAYSTEYAYDPKYRLFYGTNQPLMTPPTFAATSSKPFKPSTEYVRYSEVDPFYHSDEFDLVQTSPKTNDVFENPKPTTYSFPTSEVLTTDNPVHKTKPFQIIVDDMITNNTETTTTTTTTNVPNMHQSITKSSPVNKIETTTFQPQNNFIIKEQSSPQNIPSEKPKYGSNKNKFSPSIAFGEKIIPKSRTTTTTTIKPKSTTNKPKNTKHKTILDYSREVETVPKETTNRPTTLRIPQKFTENPESVPKILINQAEETQQFNNSFTTEVAESSKTETFQTTTPSYTESTTEPQVTFDKITSTINLLDTTTSVNDVEPTTILWNNKQSTNISKIQSNVESSLPLTDSDYITSTTESDREKGEDSESTTVQIPESTTEDFTSSDIQSSKDFFTSLTNLFMGETTTNSNLERETEIPTMKTISDAETQESKQHKTHYRLLTFPGDPVSIVANRISKTVSYKTAAGKERKLPRKLKFSSRYRFSDPYKDYNTIL